MTNSEFHRSAASESATDGGPVQNTDRHLWPQVSRDAYAPSLFVTADGEGIGINVGGHVFVKPLREWHALAVQSRTPAQPEQVPKAWFCFVPSPPGEEEPLRIRAWTTDAERAKRIGEVIGREFEPLYASQPSPSATVEKSAPGFSTSQDCCPEREPSSDAAPPGADTSEYRWPGDNKTQSERQQCSAGTAGEPVAWRWNTIGDQAWRVTINRPVPTNLTAFDKIEPLYATQPQTAPLTEFRKLQDIIDSQADRILDLESMVNELHHALTSPMTRPQSGSGL